MVFSSEDWPASFPRSSVSALPVHVIGEAERAAAHPDHVDDRASSAYLVAAAARVISDVAEQREAARAAGKKLATITMEAEVRLASPATQTPVPAARCRSPDA